MRCSCGSTCRLNPAVLIIDDRPLILFVITIERWSRKRRRRIERPGTGIRFMAQDRRITAETRHGPYRTSWTCHTSCSCCCGTSASNVAITTSAPRDSRVVRRMAPRREVVMIPSASSVMRVHGRKLAEGRSLRCHCMVSRSRHRQTHLRGRMEEVGPRRRCIGFQWGLSGLDLKCHV
jgi:hypothetical protein